jgi:hypothetical protein
MAIKTPEIPVFAGEEKQGGIAPNYLFSSRHF